MVKIKGVLSPVIEYGLNQALAKLQIHIFLLPYINIKNQNSIYRVGGFMNDILQVAKMTFL